MIVKLHHHQLGFVASRSGTLLAWPLLASAASAGQRHQSALLTVCNSNLTSCQKSKHAFVDLDFFGRRTPVPLSNARSRACGKKSFHRALPLCRANQVFIKAFSWCRPEGESGENVQGAILNESAQQPRPHILLPRGKLLPKHCKKFAVSRTKYHHNICQTLRPSHPSATFISWP